MQAALDDKVAAVEAAAVVDTVLRELTNVCRGSGSSVRSKLHPDDTELCMYGERHSEQAACGGDGGAQRDETRCAGGVWSLGGFDKSVEECTYVANGQSACRISVYSQWEPLEILTFLEAHAVNGPRSI